MPEYREFGDYDSLRTSIFDRALNAMRTKFPVENDRYRLELVDVDYAGPESYSIADQKKALLTRSSLNRRINGKWRLVDKATDSVVDERPGVVAHVPYLTNRGTFINNGNEYTVANQMRLRPGVYTRRKDNGDLEAHFNILPGTGRPFRVFMDPESGIFKMRVGQANIPMYPFLRDMGVSDDQLAGYWGKDLLNVNKSKIDTTATKKMYQRLVRGAAVEPVEQIQALRDTFDNMQLDPDVVHRSLGQYLPK